MLKAKKGQVYTFGHSKPGKDIAVAAVMSALGLTELTPGVLPESWSREWRQKLFVPFANWPSEGEICENENAYDPQLLSHFIGALTGFDVPFGVGGFDFKDVRNHSSSLSFSCIIEACRIMFNDGTDAAIIPHGAIPWQGQTQVLFDWKRPADLQSLKSVMTQAQLELIGSLHTSRHPAIVFSLMQLNSSFCSLGVMPSDIITHFLAQMTASMSMML